MHLQASQQTCKQPVNDHLDVSLSKKLCSRYTACHYILVQTLHANIVLPSTRYTHSRHADSHKRIVFLTHLSHLEFIIQ